MKIILFGATGMVGEGVLMEALRDEGVDAVLVIGRRLCEITHPKLTEIIHRDFYDYGAIEDRLRGYDACLFCLGVTSVGKKEGEYRRLTYDLTMAAACTLEKQSPGMTFCYISGKGTDSTEHGKVMWARVKGKTENDIMRLGFKDAYAFRPGYIKPSPGQKRAFLAAKMLGPLYPLMHAIMPKWVCTMQDLGRAMVRVSAKGYEKKVVECVDIEKIAHA
jgi:uncharacterized protein YbjT (DUF2867 family)